MGACAITCTPPLCQSPCPVQCSYQSIKACAPDDTIHPRMGLATELVKLRENVPAAAKVEIKVLKSLEDVWEYLDDEYGDPKQLTAQRVKDLHEFRYSTKAKTDSDQGQGAASGMERSLH